MEYPNTKKPQGSAPAEDPSALRETLIAVAERLGLRQGLRALGLRLGDEVLQRLLPKIAALKLDEMVNQRADAPYITIWEAGHKKSIRMVYVNPAIERISGFSPAEILTIGFHVFVADELMTRYRLGQNGTLQREELSIEQAGNERQRQALDAHWERIYKIRTRRGTAFVKDVAEIEPVDDWFISTGTLVDVTAEVREARSRLEPPNSGSEIEGAAS